jgi:predicted metal-dependent phosphoesterase TrpH
MQRADLHIHTRASDGEFTPTQVVQAAAAARLDFIAITDHDTIDGLAEALAAAEGGPVRVLTGVEVSAQQDGDEVHVLGYHVLPDAEPLRAHQHGALGRRQERARQMVRVLQGQGITIDYEDVLRAAGGPAARAIGRPHVARALVAGGHVRSMGEAFDRYLADGGLAFVPTELPSVGDAIAMIRASGGVAVWAHPKQEVVEAYSPVFAQLGLAGIEVFRPNTTPSDAKKMRGIARELGLFLTGGSDWHGPHRARLGDFFIPADDVRELLDLAPPG